MTAPGIRPGRRNHSAFGSKRERRVAELLRAEGWVVFRCAASKPCDLIALRAGPPDKVTGAWLSGHGTQAQLIEVKGTARSPWVAWGPTERAELADAAKRAGATPMLAWWPPHESQPQWLAQSEWP